MAGRTLAGSRVPGRFSASAEFGGEHGRSSGRGDRRLRHIVMMAGMGMRRRPAEQQDRDAAGEP
jgi:hypothetical protein